MVRVVWAVAAGCGLAAQAVAAAPSFEVASVKASQMTGPGSRRERIESPPGSLIMTNVRFVTAVRWAYHVFDYQVSGPGWIGDERFNISAKAASPVGEIELRRMLGALLAERFQLAIHREAKEMQAYVVTVGRNGHKMQQSATTGAMSVKQNGMVATVERADLDEIAAMASQPLRAPVINATGLKGLWDFKVDIAPYLTPEATSARNPTDLIGVGITAVQEQLGLRVESKKVPVEMIVIDRAEKLPTEN